MISQRRQKISMGHKHLGTSIAQDIEHLIYLAVPVRGHGIGTNNAVAWSASKKVKSLRSSNDGIALADAGMVKPSGCPGRLVDDACTVDTALIQIDHGFVHEKY